jgi:two-component system sensor histidine kinase ChvG
VTVDFHDRIGATWLISMIRRIRRYRRGLLRRMRPVTRAMSARFASSLTRRIVFLNLGGLVALAVGFLYVNQFREGLIDARVQSLETQGEIIAAAISASASVETDAITVDPEKLLQLSPGQSSAGTEDQSPSLQFSINPERIGPVLRRLVLPTRTRARIFDRDGYLLLDSRSLNRRGNTVRQEAPTTNAPSEEALTLIERTWNAVKGRFGTPDPPRTQEFNGRNGKNFPEVAAALTGATHNVVRVNAKGDTIISVAVPIQRQRSVKGALLLSTLGGDIDSIIAAERWAIVRIFLVSAAIMFLLSLFLAGTIAEPMRRLAEASDRVRRGTRSRQEIPDFTSRSDEIGHLSGSLRDMTKALYNRIEAIERFAADVAHELKNPLTSLRSAVETLPIAKTDTSRDRLLAIIQHDVKRLDRLISDISDASRLDAELARADNQEVDILQVLEAVVAVSNGIGKDDVRISLDVTPMPDVDDEASRFLVLGYDSRLGQVFNNLIDNARSFSAQSGTVRVCMRKALSGAPGAGREGYEIVIDDDGPGIPADAFERIFERFYTDRPNHGFGQNSGLGLSISRQIVEVHGGSIHASNRKGERVEPNPAAEDDEEDDVGDPILGARFVVWLPAILNDGA